MKRRLIKSKFNQVRVELVFDSILYRNCTFKYILEAYLFEVTSWNVHLSDIVDGKSLDSGVVKSTPNEQDSSHPEKEHTKATPREGR